MGADRRGVGPQGAEYYADFSNTSANPGNYRVESDGSISVVPPNGRLWHGWGTPTRTNSAGPNGTFSASDIGGIFATVQARLIPNVAGGTIPAGARYIVNVGADYYPPYGSDLGANYYPGVGGSRFKLLPTSGAWIAVNMHTMSEAAIRANPPPVLASVDHAPTVSAGPDQVVTLPATASLVGAASDDGLPNPPATVTTTWSVVSGPGTVAFANAAAARTTASFGAPGAYVLRLTASDGALSASDTVAMIVNAAATTSGTGLTGQYWTDQAATFVGAPTLTRTDATVDFAWGSGSPAPTISVDAFTARWTGQVQPRYSQTYTFSVTGDDGVRLWVGGVLLVDRWVDQSPTEASGAIALVAGRRYDIRMEYYEHAGGASAKLAWSSASQAKGVIPASALYPAVVLPAGWATSDVGAVGAAGSAAIGGATWTISGSGADIWGGADAFRFAYRALVGDGEIAARVASLTATDPWAKAGVMIRETLDPGSRHAMCVITPGNGVAFQRRLAPQGASSSTAGAPVVAPTWVKLRRVGTTITAYESGDGTTWRLVASQTIAVGANAFVGLAVTSHRAGALASAVFDHVSVVAGPVGPG